MRPILHSTRRGNGREVTYVFHVAICIPYRLAIISYLFGRRQRRTVEQALEMIHELCGTALINIARGELSHKFLKPRKLLHPTVSAVFLT